MKRYLILNPIFDQRILKEEIFESTDYINYKKLIKKELNHKIYYYKNNTIRINDGFQKEFESKVLISRDTIRFHQSDIIIYKNEIWDYNLEISLETVKEILIMIGFNLKIESLYRVVYGRLELTNNIIVDFALKLAPFKYHIAMYLVTIKAILMEEMGQVDCALRKTISDFAQISDYPDFYPRNKYNNHFQYSHQSKYFCYFEDSIIRGMFLDRKSNNLMK